jgi:hypothetical protein
MTKIELEKMGRLGDEGTGGRGDWGTGRLGDEETGRLGDWGNLGESHTLLKNQTKPHCFHPNVNIIAIFAP